MSKYLTMTNENLKSITEYAALCGVTRQAINMRIDRGTLKIEYAYNGKVRGRVVDISIYPPIKYKAGRKPFIVS